MIIRFDYFILSCSNGYVGSNSRLLDSNYGNYIPELHTAPVTTKNGSLFTTVEKSFLLPQQSPLNSLENDLHWNSIAETHWNCEVHHNGVSKVRSEVLRFAQKSAIYTMSSYIKKNQLAKMANNDATQDNRKSLFINFNFRILCIVNLCLLHNSK